MEEICIEAMFKDSSLVLEAFSKDGPAMQKVLRSLYTYDNDNGRLRYRAAMSDKVKVGDLVGWVSQHGTKFTTKKYRRVTLHKRSFYEHTLIWVFHYGMFPKGVIDHVDHDSLNNRIENLRDTTHTDNCRNQNKAKNNKSGVTGVSWNSLRRNWEAQIHVDGKRIWLGNFADIADAAKARAAANIKYGFHATHGESGPSSNG